MQNKKLPPITGAAMRVSDEPLRYQQQRSSVALSLSNKIAGSKHIMSPACMCIASVHQTHTHMQNDSHLMPLRTSGRPNLLCVSLSY
jgi:hypothetical protein